MMSQRGVQLRTDGMNVDDLYDEWQRLERAHDEAETVVDAVGRKWTASRPYERAQTFSEYDAALCELWVLRAWKEVFHSVWVFMLEGYESRFLPEEYTSGSSTIG